MSVMVCVAGDVMLDILVSTQGPLRSDDDTPASITLSAGGQAANVAAWVCALGGRAGLYGPRTRDAAGQVVDGQLRARGIHLYADPHDAHSGAVVSWVTAGKRTMASDPGDLAWIDDRLADPSWLAGADWLHLSGYLLLRAPDPAMALRAARAVRQLGVRVSVDLASAAMIETYGAQAFRALVDGLDPTVVFGNEAEWDAVGGLPDPLSVDAVVKRGALGATFVVGERADVTGDRSRPGGRRHRCRRRPGGRLLRGRPRDGDRGCCPMHLADGRTATDLIADAGNGDPGRHEVESLGVGRR